MPQHSEYRIPIRKKIQHCKWGVVLKGEMWHLRWSVLVYMQRTTIGTGFEIIFSDPINEYVFLKAHFLASGFKKKKRKAKMAHYQKMEQEQ